MRGRALHEALREFALEAAALLTEELRGGAELEFAVTEESRRGGPALYRYQPLTERFIAARWERLRQLPSREPAAEALGAGASRYLEVHGLRGEQAEPALQAMLERLYEDATSFGFPEERFERVYGDVEHTLFGDTVAATILAPLPGLLLAPGRVELGDGLALVRGETYEAPPQAVGDGEPRALCVLECAVSPGEPLPVDAARERFRRLVTALRLFKAGGVTLAPVGWQRAAEGRWQLLELEPAGAARGEPWTLAEEEEEELRGFLDAFEGAAPGAASSWALGRFEMGCSRAHDSEALSDYLLALRGLLDATTDAGQASLSLRLAALCAEEGQRRALQRRVELALGLERFLMGGRADGLEDAIGAESPRELVAEVEHHLRALLRDLVCGYLAPDLRSVADDILLESTPEPFAIEARRITRPARFRPQEPEPEPQPQPDEEEEVEGVTPSADWGPLDEDPESYSAPV